MEAIGVNMRQLHTLLRFHEHKRYWIDVGCFSFVMIFFLSMTGTFMASLAIAIEDFFGGRRTKTSTAISGAVWAVILAVVWYMLRTGFIDYIIPP